MNFRAQGNRYNNKKITDPATGEKFDSKREYTRWQELCLMERVGAISGLHRQTPFILAPAVKLNGRTKPCLRYVADFTYVSIAGDYVVEDSKNDYSRKHDAVYRIKRHLMCSVHGIIIQEA